jgi:hypothetical protein
MVASVLMRQDKLSEQGRVVLHRFVLRYLLPYAWADGTETTACSSFYAN